MLKLSRTLVALGGLVALAACGDDVTVTPPPDPVITAVTVSPASLEIRVGGTATLGVSVSTTGNVADKSVTWTSSNTSIATVSSAGLVTGVAVGVTTVRAAATADASKVGAAEIRVVSGVQSVVVTPMAVTLQVGGTSAAAATVTRDAGVAGTVTWASNAPAVATVSATGVITGVTVGTAVVTATSTVDASKTASIAVTVTAVANNLLSLDVNPKTVNIGPGGAQQLTSTVNTVGSPTVTYTYSSGNTAVATVSAAGLVTGVANGTTVVTVTATTNTNAISVSVTVNVSAASVSIASLTQGGLSIPVNLAGVAGQIEATLNITSGSQQIDRVEVLIDNVVAASQVFGVNGAPNAPVTLSINTAVFDMTTFVPSFINGPRTLSAKIYPVGGAAPTASNTIQFTLANPDVVYFNPTLGTTAGNQGLNHTGTSAAGPIVTVGTFSGSTYWAGGFTYRANPVSYSGQIASIQYTSDDCGAVVAIAAPWAATFACVGVENNAGVSGLTQSIQNAILLTYNAGYTLTAAPVGFMTAASPGYVPGKPVYAAVNTLEDNVGPTSPAPILVNMGAAGGTGGVWLGTPAGFSSVATDAGVGLGTQPVVNGHASTPTTGTGAYPVLNTNITNVCSANVSSNSNMPETLNPTSYVAQATGSVDALGNAGGASAVSTPFGIDCVVSDVKYIGTSTGGGGPFLNAFVSADSTAFTAAPAGVFVGAEAIDIFGRSGLWNVNAPFNDAHGSLAQKVVRLAPASNNVACYEGPQGPFPHVGVFGSTTPLDSLWENLGTILANNYAQSDGLTSIFCAGLSGYYTWSGRVWDRALNFKQVPYNTTSKTSVITALDLLAPSVTGVGFVNPLYTGGQSAPFSISANDDLEVIEARIGLVYSDAGGMTVALRYPFGSTALSLNNGTGTNQTWGMRWDNVISSTINAGEASVNFFIARLDSVVANTATNVAGHVTSGDSLATVEVEVNDVAGTPSNQLAATVLNTQLTPTTSQFTGATVVANLVGFTVSSTAAGTLTMQQIGPSGTATQQCTSYILWRSVPGYLDFVQTLTTTPTITDNGTNRFFTWTVTGLTAGNYRAMCVRNGTGLLSTTQPVA